jgi:DNA-binding response OmpR family regulator
MSEKVSILIIDDDKGMCETLSDILQEKGYRTETAKTGQEAIVKTRKRFFNVALIDIKLPDVTGIEVLKTFRVKHPSMMTIMATGYATLKNAVEALNSGADAYVMKPIDPEGLDRMIKEFSTAAMNKFVTSLEVPASLREKIPKPFLERVVRLKEPIKRVYIALYSHRKPATALEIAEPLGLARAYASMRLNQLESMGLVKRRKAGKKRLFEVAL